MNYFVVMIERSRGYEAIVDPDHTRGDAVELAREAISEGRRVLFVHHIHDGVCEDVTAEIVRDAQVLMLQAAE